MYFFRLTDPSTPARYFCSHKAGIHCVGLPMVAQLTEMAQRGKVQFKIVPFKIHNCSAQNGSK